ncbi:glycoside hydrolase family 2 protein [Jeotgalibaca sp. MA1X17-3]|uniref:glycoside hydrolase family 2 protein n=1 Tax=Jeotgalibaca sp. MA1X17-3 TaxID=2908211 RepID=UPI001F2583FA|nr:glycoside hydrolase family 2 TIM barrel-domain containing protein [Jeotgalibaca sp. MA1X17-3]UJF15277.1 glycoside hydrolase family 2 protein [Jeotgalibaca sp. MA1X17-3]
MRIKKSLNQDWSFTKEQATMDTLKDIETFESVKIPHTWNNLDGQDGGLDYYRGVCWYKKELDLGEEAIGKRVYLEFEGSNSITDVYVNGKKATHHEGGFSTFRVELTPFLLENEVNELAVSVDNRANDYIYPQMADFTFFGGIYRAVNLILVEDSHFDLEYYGSKGVKVTPDLKDQTATIRTEYFVTNPKENQTLKCTIYTHDNQVVSTQTASVLEKEISITVENPHLWNGVKDPYLYKMDVILKSNDHVLDNVSVKFGIRNFHVDPEQGFFLNGESYPLRGVSRHQDREDMGWALTGKEHKEDMEYIAEVGANTIRLAHYQHDSYFYDLCDEYGMVVWAEIPFISSFMENGYQNTITQMKELVIQNDHHPSICFWGISNEISMGGEPDILQQNLRELNDLTHELDPTRLTTIANASMTKFDSEHNFITDIVAYNHYYGWYGGSVEDNGTWFDSYHESNPNRAIGLSEYGAEGILAYHNHDPKIRDYSEEYQAYYHEQMLEMFETRPYIWATHVWNMFDFAADGRDEGGVKGRNNKGLMTHDRSTKKDSFFVYKAYWTTEPFVHICSRRFIDRPEENTPVKVYSNCDSVTLLVDNQEVDTVTAHKIFAFPTVPLAMGENTITAIGYKNGEEQFIESITLNRVTEPNPDYTVKDEAEGEGADNWFVEKEDGTVGFFEFPEGFFSIHDTIEEITATDEGMDFMLSLLSTTPIQGNQKELLDYLKGYTVKALLKLTSGDGAKPETLLMINEALNKLPKAPQNK